MTDPSFTSRKPVIYVFDFGIYFSLDTFQVFIMLLGQGAYLTDFSVDVFKFAEEIT